MIYWLLNNNSVEIHFTNEEIQSISPLDFLNLKNIDQSDSFIVLCELNEDKAGKPISRTEFYGISFVQELRRRDFKNKVLFVSFLPESYFENQVLNAQIMFFPGHAFLQLPASPQDCIAQLDTFNALTELSLYDVKHHCTGIAQIIDEQLHSLTPKFQIAKTLSPQLKNEAKKVVSFIYSSLGKSIPDVENVLNEDLSGVEALRKLRSLCESILPETTSLKQSELSPEYKYWKVLWLDDEEDEYSPLYLELVKRLGSTDKVILCRTYDEALLQWEADKAYGEISLVICDYRLKNNKGKPADKQGYDFMKELAQSDRSIGIMAYSGLKRKFLIESFRHYGIQVNMYSKIDFNQHNPNDLAFLADEAIRLGDIHWIAINNAPQAKEWEKLAPIYHGFKNGFSYYTFQNYISKLAKENLELFIENFNRQTTSQDLWSLTFTDQIVVRTSKFPAGKGAQEEGIKDILTVRRFAIGLYAFLQSEKNTKKALLKPEYFLSFTKVVLYNSSSNGSGYYVDLSSEDVYNDIKNNSTLKLIFKFNALTFDSTWPLGLLPEEYGWLKFDMNLVKETYEEIFNYLKQIHIIKNSFSDLFSQEPFCDWLKNGEGAFELSLGKIHFNDQYKPLIRNTADAKKLLKAVYEKLDAKNEKAHQTFIDLWRGLVSQLNKDEFRTSKLVSDFLYYITQTIETKKIDVDDVKAGFIKRESSEIKHNLEALAVVAEEVSENNREKKLVDAKDLIRLLDTKGLSLFTKGLLRNVIKSLITKKDNNNLLEFLKISLELLNNCKYKSFVDHINKSHFVPGNFQINIEIEYIILHKPWEFIFSKRQRLKPNFKEESAALFEAIKTKDTTHKNEVLFNQESIFSNTLSDFIQIYHDKDNRQKKLDLYFRAIEYKRRKADFYEIEYNTNKDTSNRQNEDQLSAIDMAERQKSQMSLAEHEEYFNNLLDEEPGLSLDTDFEDFEPDSERW